MAEFTSLCQINKFVISALVVSLIFVIPLISWISAHMTNRLKKLMRSLEIELQEILTSEFSMKLMKHRMRLVNLQKNILIFSWISLTHTAPLLKSEINDRIKAEKQLAIFFKEFAENSGQVRR